MTKKVFLFVLLAVLAAGAGFAQDPGSGHKMAASIDLGPTAKGIIAIDTDNDTGFFGIGAAFEYLIVQHFSLGLRADLIAGEIEDTQGVYFGMDAHGRWYPLSLSPEKLFIDAGIGFNTLSIDDYDELEFTGMTFGLKAGWRLVFKDRVFVEPTLGYLISKSNPVVQVTPNGWELGLSIGVLF